MSKFVATCDPTIHGKRGSYGQLEVLTLFNVPVIHQDNRKSPSSQECVDKGGGQVGALLYWSVPALIDDQAPKVRGRSSITEMSEALSGTGNQE